MTVSQFVTRSAAVTLLVFTSALLVSCSVTAIANGWVWLSLLGLGWLLAAWVLCDELWCQRRRASQRRPT